MGAEFTHVYALRMGSLKGSAPVPKTAKSLGPADNNASDVWATAPFVTVVGALCLGLYMGFIGLQAEKPGRTN
jgi:hypothetical protein